MNGGSTRAPGARDLLAIALAAILARCLLVGFVQLSEGCSLAQYTGGSDGYQFHAVVDAWRGRPDAVREQVFFRMLLEDPLASTFLVRFLPAIPATTAAIELLGAPRAAAATVPFWFLSAAAAVLCAVVARDARAGWILAALPPIHLAVSTAFSAHSWFLLAATACLLAASRQRWGWSGVAGGLSLWARPEGALLVLAGILVLASSTRWRQAAGLAASATTAVALGAALVWLRTGELLVEIWRSSRAGHGERGIGFLSLPGRDLLAAFLNPLTPTWKLAYVGAHVALAVVALALLVRAAGRASGEGEKTTARILALWFVLHLLFVLTMRGKGQAFDDFPRYLSFALPAMAIALAPRLPRSIWPWIAASLVSVAIAAIPARRAAAPVCGAEQPTEQTSAAFGGICTSGEDRDEGEITDRVAVARCSSRCTRPGSRTTSAGG